MPNNNDSILVKYDFVTDLKSGVKKANKLINDMSFDSNLSEDMKKELEQMKKDIEKNAKLIQNALDRIMDVEISTGKFKKFQTTMEKSINSIVEDISNMGAKLESVGVNNSLGQVASDIKNVSDNAKTANIAISDMIKSVKGTDVSIKLDTKTKTDEIEAIAKSLSNTIEEYERWQKIDPWKTVSKKGKDLKTDDELLSDLKQLDSEFENIYKSASDLEKELKTLKPNTEEWTIANAKLNDYKLQLVNLADKIAAVRDVLSDKNVNFGELSNFALSDELIPFLNNVDKNALKAMDALEKLASTYKQTAEIVSQEQLTVDGTKNAGAINLQVKISTSNTKLYKQLDGKINYLQKKVNESKAIIVPVKLTVEGTPFAESKKNLLSDNAAKSVRETAEGVVVDVDKTTKTVMLTVVKTVKNSFAIAFNEVRTNLLNIFKHNPIPISAKITQSSIEEIKASLNSDELTGAIDLTDGVKKVENQIDSISKKAESLISKMKEASPDYSGALKEISETIQKLVGLQKNINEFGGLKIDDGKLKLDISELVQEFQKLIDAITEAKNELTKPISLDSQWFKIGETFHELSDETGKIDFRKNKKELQEFIALYEKYVSLGGTNTLNALTDNQATLNKIQSRTSVSVDSNRQIEESNNNLLELLNTLENVKSQAKNVQELIQKIKVENAQIETFEKLGTALKTVAEALDSISKLNNLESLTDIKGLNSIAGFIKKLDKLSNATKTLSGLKLSQKNLDALEKIPNYLSKIREELEELDRLPVSNFLAQLNSITEKSSELSNLATILRNSKKEAQETVKQLSPSEQLKDSISSVKSIEKSLEKLEREYNTNKFPDSYTEKIKELREVILEFNSIIAKPKELLTQEDVSTAQDLERKIKTLNLELKEIPKLASKANISNAISKMNKFLVESTKLTKAERMQIEDLIERLRKPQLNVEEFREIMNVFNGIENNAIRAGRATSNFLDAIKNKLKYGWAEAFARFFSFYDIIRYIREVSSTVTELNSNLIELAKVSDTSIGELYNGFKDFRDIAKQTGGTINDIIKSTADWARNGYNLPESKELARLSSIFQNIGDGLSESQANEYLVSTLKGFNLEASQAIDIMDAINNVSNNAASSVANIGEALERSSSAFGAANTDLNESIALLTSANEVLQNPETVGGFAPTCTVMYIIKSSYIG